MTLAGCWLALSDNVGWWRLRIPINPGDIELGRWALLSVALTAMFGLVYLLNQMRDRETDKQNKKLFLVAEGALSQRHLIIEAVILAVIAITALLISRFGHLGLWVVVLFTVIGILYNYTPIALKQRPWGGLIAYAVGGWMFVRLGGMIYGVPIDWYLEAPYVIAFTASCLLTNLPDREGDITEGKRTFVVVYGNRTTMAVAVVGFILTIFWGIAIRDWVIALPAIAATPILLSAWKKNSIPLSVKANKMAIFLISVFVGITFPVYLLIIIIYYPLARWYHHHRFGMNYPSFR